MFRTLQHKLAKKPSKVVKSKQAHNKVRVRPYISYWFGYDIGSPETAGMYSIFRSRSKRTKKRA
jgi:hypothetical protein